MIKWIESLRVSASKMVDSGLIVDQVKPKLVLIALLLDIKEQCEAFTVCG